MAFYLLSDGLSLAADCGLSLQGSLCLFQIPASRKSKPFQLLKVRSTDTSYQFEMDTNNQSPNKKSLARQSSTISGKKAKKRPFNYLLLFVGSILVVHITFLWSQQQLVELNSFEVKISPGSVDKSFDLTESKNQVKQGVQLNEASNVSQLDSIKKEKKIGDKSRIVSILEASGINITDDIFARLPTWDIIQSMYGPSPVIYGIETCSAFQRSIPKNEAYIGPAGTFNTGTNLLADLLPKYCYIESDVKRSGMLWQVPWGKHNPISWRFRNIAIGLFTSPTPILHISSTWFHRFRF